LIPTLKNAEKKETLSRRTVATAATVLTAIAHAQLPGRFCQTAQSHRLRLVTIKSEKPSQDRRAKEKWPDKNIRP
jgi:hypothetical protein